MNILNEIKLKNVKLPDIRGYNTIGAGNRHTRTERKKSDMNAKPVY